MSFIEFRNVTKVYGEGAAAVRAADTAPGLPQ